MGSSGRIATVLAALMLATGCAAGNGSTSSGASPRPVAAHPSPSGIDCWRSGTSGDDWNDWESRGPGMGAGTMGCDD
ncbi:hypothetical protein [Streptomyces sp. NPDC058872]|uniref:hypothetical protein n=1 Tax=Streptomyces sp. NPDC058872 TaxID=3346661 RepID=UPI0036D17BD2